MNNNINNVLWKLNAFIIVVLSIMIISSISVEGLGVAPSRKIVDYALGEQAYTARIINNENKDMKVLIYFQGELAEYARIDKSILSIKSDEPEKSFTYNVNIPEGLSPGTRKLDVMILELSPEIDTDKINDKTMILSTVLVVHQLRVNVPYPGLFAEGTMYVSSNDKYATITVNVLNKGTMDIRNINGELIIKGPTNEEISRIKVSTITEIKAGNTDKFVVNTPELNPGLYYIEFIVNYDNKQFVLREQFMIGDKDLTIESINSENFKLGNIARFDIDVLNKWNQPITSVYADVKVINSQSVEVSSFRTTPASINPLSREKLVGYWDTRGIEQGLYDLRIILNYEDKKIEKIFRSVIGIDSIKLQDSSLSGQVVVSKGEGNKLSLLYILVIISIIFNIILFVYFKFIRKKIENT